MKSASLNLRHTSKLRWWATKSYETGFAVLERHPEWVVFTV
jgi:hypothetical protein